MINNSNDSNDSCLESYHFGSFKREYKKERKMAQKNDRSHDKFTSKRSSAQPQKYDSRGIVIEVHGQVVTVSSQEEIWNCHLKGSFKEKKRQEKNIIAVGDQVGFRHLEDQQGIIEYIAPRQGLLHRSDNLNRNRLQLIAVNIDWVIVTVSVVSPLLRPSLIDRYLIAAKSGGIQSAICFTKTDLLTSNFPEQKELLDRALTSYQNIGIPCFCLQNTPNPTDDFSQLKEFLSEKTAVFSGQSGVGKSTLINRLTGLNLKTGEVITKTDKGAHTTSKSKLIPLKDQPGWLVDTPGIKSFGIWQADIKKVQEGFDEIFIASRNCKFNNCKHEGEPGCAIVAAVEDGSVSKLRYDSYLQILLELNEPYRRR